MSEFNVRLNYLLPTLPQAERSVALYVQNNLSSIPTMTIGALSEQTSSSEATVLRFCRKMGYSSFILFKQECMRESFQSRPDVPGKIQKDDNIETTFNKVIDALQESLKNTRALFSRSAYQAALDALLGAEHVYLVATGDADAVCALACAKFNRIGISAVVLSNLSYQYETAIRMKSGDVLIALSASGRSQNIVRCARLARDSGAKIIAITQSAKSPLMRNADISLITSTIDVSKGRDSICKRVAELAILECLYLGAISQGPLDYDKLLDCTLQSFAMNSN